MPGEAPVWQADDSMFNSDDALRPVHYEECNWMDEAYSTGCYSSVMAPMVLTQYARCVGLFPTRTLARATLTADTSASPWAICTSVARKQRHGESATTILAAHARWAGYMSGAIESGERAALEVLVDLNR
jgi:monoamine oxidase